MEVAQVMLRLTMTAEEQRVGKQWTGWDGMAAQSTLKISLQDLCNYT